MRLQTNVQAAHAGPIGKKHTLLCFHVLFNICVFRVCTAVVVLLPVAHEGGAEKNTGENAGASTGGSVRMKLLLWNQSAVTDKRGAV